MSGHIHSKQLKNKWFFNFQELLITFFSSFVYMLFSVLDLVSFHLMRLTVKGPLKLIQSREHAAKLIWSASLLLLPSGENHKKKKWKKISEFYWVCKHFRNYNTSDLLWFKVTYGHLHFSKIRFQNQERRQQGSKTKHMYWTFLCLTCKPCVSKKQHYSTKALK